MLDSHWPGWRECPIYAPENADRAPARVPAHDPFGLLEEAVEACWKAMAHCANPLPEAKKKARPEGRALNALRIGNKQMTTLCLASAEIKLITASWPSVSIAV
jgi:hypothetical protein